MQSARCIRAPGGPQDALPAEKVRQYLALVSAADERALTADGFAAAAAQGAEGLQGQALVEAVSRALASASEPLRAAIDEELRDAATLGHAVLAFSQASGKADSGAVAASELPAFARFVVAYRIHCYFETSLLPGRCLPQPAASAAAGQAGQGSEKPRVVFVLGGPGSGKGTQCARISETYGYTHLSAGDLLREERSRPGSEYGELIEAKIRQGELVPIEITIRLIENAMRASGWSGGKFLIDGFPRSFDNWNGWKEVMGDKAEVQFSLFFSCSEACMEKRLLERGKSSGRSDDNIEAIRKRFVTFEKESMPIAEHFNGLGLLRKVSSERSKEEVWAAVQQFFGPTVVFVLGGPGAGKGTICSRLSDTFGYKHLSAGDLLREERKRPGSKIGALIEEHIKEGKLVPAEITVRLLLAAMQEQGWQGGRYLIDGFPRSHDNLRAWDKETAGRVNVKFCLFLECSEGIMEARLLERGKTSGRSDDNLESIRKRFITFHSESLPVVQYFGAKNQLQRVNAEQNVDQVWDDVQTLFGPSVVFVLGGPGAGKGTQCSRIVDLFGYKHLSAGDLLRAERKRPGSEMGELIESYIKDGKIVPVEITVKLLLKAMEEEGWDGGKYLVDGFPRSLDNLEGWNKVVGSRAKVKFALFFNCSEETMEARLLERGKTSGRSDDNLESIRKRFRTFRDESMPVVQLLDQSGLLRRIDCEVPPDEVWEDVRKLFIPKVIFMVGGPGAGKGTQCARISPSFGFHHLSIGDLLREESEKDSEMGRTIKAHVQEGRLVPVDLVLQVLRTAMERRGWEGGKYLIDGFPRSSENWEGWQKKFGQKVHVQCMICLDCSENVKLERLKAAASTSKRPTDSVEVIKKRFAIYRTETQPVISAFLKQGLLRTVDGEQTPDAVWGCLQELLHDELDLHAPNQAVVMVKPHAHTKDVDRFVQSYLTTHGIAVLKRLVIPGSEVRSRQLFKRQYGRIIQFAEADPASLVVPAAGQLAFKEAQGSDWGSCLVDGSLVSAVGAMARLQMSAQELFSAWSGAATLKLGPDMSVGKVSKGEKSFFVVNGFVPYWQQSFSACSDVLALVVEFDRTKLSWRAFRAEIIGATDPRVAPENSIRRQLWEHWQSLGLTEQPNKLNNCIHASAGPLEGLRERLLWCGCELHEDLLGRQLLLRGVPRKALDAWLENAEVEGWRASDEAGVSKPIFDRTEDCDTDTFCADAVRYAVANSATGLESWPMKALTRPAETAVWASEDCAEEHETLPTRMTILHFNDVYNVEPRPKEPVGGLARFVTRIRELKAESVARGEPEAVVLFSGDAFNPSLTSTTTMGRHMVPALNYIGIHTACYGNHDFDFGVDQLVSMAADNNFPWLISNVTDKKTGRPLAEGIVSRMMNFHGRKIGLIGLVEREWLVTLATLSPDDVEYEDFCPCAARLARDLKQQQGAEIVIALTHMRVPNDELLAHEVPEVDLILGGHDHHYDVKPVGPHGTYVLKSGTDFRDITALQIEFKPDGKKPFTVVSHSHEEIVASIKEDPEVKVFVDDCVSKVGAAMDKVIGDTAVDLDSRFAAIRTQETNIGNFVADVMRNSLHADVAVINSGTLRADAIIEKGPFKMRDLVNLLPMLDELCLLQLTGSQFLQVLENSVSQYPRLEGRFAQVSGVAFAFDAAKPGGQRVVLDTVKIGGEPLDPERKYTLCTKDYLRQGKDGYDVFRDAVCLADGEQAGILPSIIREHFQNIATLNGEFESAPAFATTRGSVLGACPDEGLARVGDGPEALRRLGINPKIEARIVCLNPVAT